VSNQKYDPCIYRHRFQKKKNLLKWNRTPKGSSIFGNARAYLFVGTIVTIVYRVKSSSTKSTTLTLIDLGSQKSFKNGTERRKACRIFSNVRIYLFVDTRVHSLVVPNQKYDPHTNRHRFPKIFQKWNQMPKGSSDFDDVRIYLFVDTIVIIVYRVVSNQKYDPRIYRHRFPKKKIFQNETERRKARQFLVMRVDTGGKFLTSLIK
jgi:hypothetical protein